MSFSTETKANIAFILALIILGIVGVFRYSSATTLIESGKRVAHTYEVIAEIERVRFLTKGIESSERGYKLSYDKKFGDEIEQAKTKVNDSISKLRSMTSDNEHQQANVNVLEKHVARFLDSVHSTLAGTVNAPSSQLLGSVLDQLQAAKLEEQDLLKARTESEEHTAYVAVIMITVATGVSMIVLIVAMVALKRDSKARRKAEADYRFSEERLRLLLNSVSEGIYGIDMDGKCTFANPACAKTLGYLTVEQLHGKNMHELIHYQYEDGRPFPVEECKIYQAFTRGEEVVVNDEVFWRADKSSFPVEYRSCPVRREGVVIGAVVAFTDITDRKRAERTLSSARDMAMESARLKSEFLANMSHEIRTPLNGVIGMSELLISTRLTGREREYAVTIRNSAESLLTILNDILDLSKIDAGKLTLEAIHFNLQTIVEESGMLIAARASEKKLELIVRYAPGAPKTFIGDPVRMRQILSNLASNAVKFTQEGHVLISVACHERVNGRAVMHMTVEDTGIGISDEYRSRLFQKFSQADSSTTRQFGGTGLGLAISKNLVEMMGGTLSVSSVIGKGTVFTLEVPLPESEKKEELSVTTMTQYALRARCLVVDDNAVNRMVVQEQLSVWQVPVKAVEHGQAALEELRRAAEAGEEYAVALLDYQMPNMNGETLAQKIKADPKIAKTVLVMLSSVGETFTPQQLRASGIVEMLHKPVRQSELFDALQSAWRVAFEGGAHHSSGEQDAVSDENDVPALNLRVLLVEDNDVNRAVAVGMLKRLNCACSISVDGCEALDAVRTEAFDVVLMDCQMPVMDGYTATREIRRLEKSSGRPPIPIVAMTANAMKGDRERCLEAGMDDYLAKPVRLAQLADILARSAGRPALPRRHSKSSTPTVAAETTQETPAPVFDLDAAMRIVGGDGALLKEVIKVFLDDVPKRIANMKDALIAGNTSTAERCAHSIKGASGNVGGERLRQMAYHLETACRDNDVKQAATLTAELETELAALRTELLKLAQDPAA